MRVIAGRLGGRRLQAPRGRATTRPTSDRVKEALFSMLGDLRGAVALDLFAGTGALGIEALSRGAERVVFVERDSVALQALRANLGGLGLGSPEAEVREGEALAALDAARVAGETYDLVFVDPPYGRTRELEGRLSALLPALLGPGARVVVESDRRMQAELPLEVAQRKRYGDTTITIHRRVTEDGNEH
jgi:16S rRNA (guanine966-N2)-methyltransferase